jgi:predicted ATP-dependent protease
MTTTHLTSSELRLTIDPVALGFSDTAELLAYPLPWIGQERAEMAARFGLSMDHADYNLFVLGEVGSGRSSLLQQAMIAAASSRATPPDLCYLHNFDVPEKPRALRLPAGQGRHLRLLMTQMSKNIQTLIPQRLSGQDFKTESACIQNAYKAQEACAYAELDAFAEARNFILHRESGRLVFTLMGEKRHAFTEPEVFALPKERRAEIDKSEQELREEISRFLEKMRPMEQLMKESFATLRCQWVKTLLDHEMQEIRSQMKKQIKDAIKISAYLEQVTQDILDNIDLFQVAEADDEIRQEELGMLLSRYHVNLVVDNDGLVGAPVIVEDNPLFRSLFGSIEYQSDNDVLVTDFSRIRAGSLLKAHGGFLLLHLRDLLVDGLVWEKLRRLLRSGKLQIEEPGTAYAPIAAVSLEPEAVDVEVKIILIGSRDQYYELQEEDPEFARRFRVKVDFAERFIASQESRRSFAIFVAHSCQTLGLPHFSSAAVARLIENTHREVDDQARQSAIFAHSEALLIESAALCRARAAHQVDVVDVDAALAAGERRHDYPAQCLREAISDGEVLIAMHGEKVGQLNGLTVIDLGDCRIGYPVRLTARTFAGSDGLLNIEREVEMSGPIHDKGVFILQHYLSALFAHLAPLALNASLVFEQEYHGVEGDSASCAELYVLLSSLSGLPLKQGTAVTGAVNQHGEVLPVGGINEKIEGYFRVCETAGLDGTQGVLIPSRNRRHLMLEHRVIAAVEQGLFHIHSVEHVSSGMELLMGLPAGVADGEGDYPHGSVLGRAQKTLQAYRRACQASEHPKAGRKHLR